MHQWIKEKTCRANKTVSGRVFVWVHERAMTRYRLMHLERFPRADDNSVGHIASNNNNRDGHRRKIAERQSRSTDIHLFFFRYLYITSERHTYYDAASSVMSMAIGLARALYQEFRMMARGGKIDWKKSRMTTSFVSSLRALYLCWKTKRIIRHQHTRGICYLPCFYLLAFDTNKMWASFKKKKFSSAPNCSP